VQPLIIRGSRWKFAAYLLIGLIFVATGAVMVRHPDNPTVCLQGWLAIAFFGLCSLGAGWMVARPQTMRLDAEGLTLDGGLLRRPRTLLWRDVERFKVFVAPRGGKLLGYERPRDPLVEPAGARVSRFLGADGALPGGWPQSVEKMVALLNDYRTRALKLRT
jgi:hypothetical protein